MKRNSIIGVSIAVVGLFVLTSFTSVVGVQIVESPNQELINDEIDPKELLLETIVEIANNPEVKELLEQVDYELFDSDYNFRGVFFKLLIFKPRVLLFMFFIKPKMNIEYLNKAYDNGVEIVDVLGEEEALKVIESFEITNPQILNDMTEIISNNPNLQERIEQLVDLECDCENDFSISWNFPVICILLVPFLAFSLFIYQWSHIAIFAEIIFAIGSVLNCIWVPD